jgi:hypothetical protein
MNQIAKIAPWAVGLIAVFLLISHTFSWPLVKVDHITILLLAVIALVPFVELVRKIKIGEFEAEIAPREVAEASAKVSKEVPTDPSHIRTEEGIAQEVLDLVQTDPPLALAKLRMELERLLRRLHEHIVHPKKTGKYITLGRMARNLGDQDIISKEMSAGLVDVISLANRAVHGENIRKADAEELARLGTRLLDELNYEYQERIAKPTETEIISSEKMHEYMGATYRVRTVSPSVENPTINTYILD